MNKRKNILTFRPAPNRMTFATFLLCMTPVTTGLIATIFTHIGGYACVSCLFSITAYFITKIVVAVHYEHKYEKPTTIETQN